jgi:hypothetical protein
MAVNIGELAATTMELYEKSLADNIFKRHVLLNHFQKNGGTKMYPGGKSIRVPLMYSANSTVKAFDGLDSLDLTYQDTVDAAEFDYKFYDVSIVFTLVDELKNSGPSQVLNLLEAKIKQAEMSLAERINNDFYNGAASDAKEITGLDTIIAASGTYGDINGTAYTWWRSTVDSTGETLSISDMRTAKNSANNGSGGARVSIILTTQTLYEKYHSLLTASYVMNNPVSSEGKRLGDAGFTGVEFEGVPVRYDEDATSGVMYFLNTENLKLGIHSDANFKVMKKAEPTDQHVAVQHIVFAGNTVCDRRASLAKLSSKTA